MSIRARASTPWVGSSTMSILGVRSTGRASTAFCWLPPDRAEIGWKGEAETMPRSLTALRCAGRSRLRNDVPAGPAPEPSWAVALSITDIGAKIDSAARSPLWKLIPEASALLGLIRWWILPSTEIVPPSVSMPMMPRSSARCPLPSAPATPTISPAPTVIVTGSEVATLEVCDLEPGCRGRVGRPLRVLQVGGRADHHLDDLVDLPVLGSEGSLGDAVTEDGEPIGQPADLGEAVADVDDGHALVASLS